MEDAVLVLLMDRIASGLLMLAEPVSPETINAQQISDDTALAEYIENPPRYDGSATSPEKHALIHLLSGEGRSVNAIASILSMDWRTVNAIIQRKDHLVSDARKLLKANTFGFVKDAITASSEAAKRGKLEGISAMLDRLGVTEPPKSQAQTNVGVSVVLNGGPEPVSLAKVTVQSEGHQEQAQIDVSPIRPVMLPQPTSQVIEG